MKPDIRYLNFNNPRKVLNQAAGYSEETIVQAHSIETPGYRAYVAKRYFDLVVEALEMENPDSRALKIVRGEID